MTKEKLFIRNRKKKNLSVIVEQPANSKGVIFIMHGLGGYKHQPHLEEFARIFRRRRLTVVRFDVCHTRGESEGHISKARATNYYQDLIDVIRWAAKQQWYREPFAMLGVSLGGMCVASYAQKHSSKVSALLLISLGISGKLLVKAQKERGRGFKEFSKLKEVQLLWEASGGNMRKAKRLLSAFVRSTFRFDAMKKAEKLHMPVLITVGSKDDLTPPKYLREFHEKLPDPKDIYIIPGAPHLFGYGKHLDRIAEIVSNWAKKYL